MSKSDWAVYLLLIGIGALILPHLNYWQALGTVPYILAGMLYGRRESAPKGKK